MRPLHLLPLLGLLLAPLPAPAGPPIQLHPKNPHYFLFRGKPTFLITSGEHYGAVLNQDFDYIRYLDTLKADGLNLTRTFSGTYREIPGSFKIQHNTLAPARGKYLCPWARSGTPGAGDGGNKFDLTRWDPVYFKRLKDFIGQAGKRGIVVELSLFCTIYDDGLWNVNPMKASNNVNGLGKVGRLQVYALKEPGLTAVQEKLVRKIVTELKDFDNVYYEICNEPYFGGVTREWTDRMAAVIARTEKDFPGKHLIAQNISNGSRRVDKPNPAVSIFNFHYSTPPDSVRQNYALRRAVADDETGFRGTADLPYRTGGWDFLIAGGAVYSNLDYSFTAAHPDGTFKVTTSPGGGGPGLRRQLRILKEFLEGFDFLQMAPADESLKAHFIRLAGPQDPQAPLPTVRVLARVGKAYAVYVKGGTRAELTFNLPAGSYEAEWVNTRTGKTDKREKFTHEKGARKLASPDYTEDIALRYGKQTKERPMHQSSLFTPRALALLLAFILVPGAARAADAPAVPPEVKALQGTYSGSWTAYGVDAKGQVVKRQSWTDVLRAEKPVVEKGRAYVHVTDVMTFEGRKGSPLQIQGKEGYLFTKTGKLGGYFIETLGQIHKLRRLGASSWAYSAPASSQELTQLGFPAGAAGQHVLVKVVTREQGAETHRVTRLTTVHWKDAAGKEHGLQFVSLEGFHRRQP